MVEGRELHARGETDTRWIEQGMPKSKQGPAIASPPHRRRVAPEVEQRRRVIVALLRQHPDGLTAREIREATGLSKNLTESALSGLFTRSVVHKHGHRYVLAAQDDARGP
jgi:hypothetical protein